MQREDREWEYYVSCDIHIETNSQNRVEDKALLVNSSDPRFTKVVKQKHVQGSSWSHCILCFCRTNRDARFPIESEKNLRSQMQQIQRESDDCRKYKDHNMTPVVHIKEDAM